MNYRPINESKSKQKMRQGKNVRLNINARERRRMHDLVKCHFLTHTKHDKLS